MVVLYPKFTCKIYQILRIENKSVKLRGYVMLGWFVCLLLFCWFRVCYLIDILFNYCLFLL